MCNKRYINYNYTKLLITVHDLVLLKKKYNFLSNFNGSSRLQFEELDKFSILYKVPLMIVIFVVKFFLKNKIWMDILQLFMKASSHTSRTQVFTMWRFLFTKWTFEETSCCNSWYSDIKKTYVQYMQWKLCY